MSEASYRWLTAAILLLALGLFFGRLGQRAITSEEMRWAEVAREMRLTGDYFHPTINGQTYYDKPLGSYWLIVAASYLTGGVTPTAARLPAAFAGLFGVLLTVKLGRRLFDGRVGIFAGAILTTSFGFAFYARRATADVETVTGVLAAIYLYARHLDRPAGAWVVGLWSIMAATSLTKGLLGFALPVAVIAIHSAWMGRADAGSWRGAISGQLWLWNRWTLLAVPLGLALFVTPFAISVSRMGSNEGVEMLLRENVRRFFAPHNHTGPVYLYAEAIFVLLAPWSLFLPAALWPVKAKGRGETLALVFFWTLFAFFTASASRRNYYLLPILPAAAMLIARTLLANDLPTRARRLRTAGRWLMLALIAASGVLLLSPADILPPPWNLLPPLPARELFAVGWIVVLALAIRDGWDGFSGIASPRTPMVLTTIAAVAMNFLFLVAIPHYGSGEGRNAFVAELKATVRPEGLALFHARDIVYELAAPTPIPEYRDAAALESDLQNGRILWVAARRRAIPAGGFSADIVLEELAPAWEEQGSERLVLLRSRRSSP